MPQPCLGADHGSWQEAADAEFGDGTVIIRSAMTQTGD